MVTRNFYNIPGCLISAFLFAGCATDDDRIAPVSKPANLRSNLAQNEVYTYNELATRDLDNMANLVRLRVKKSEALLSGKEVPLQEALKLIYARPNKDGMIEKIIGPVRAGLDEQDLWESSHMTLIDEALAVLTTKAKVSARVQVTYCFILENMISEFKPRVDKVGFEKRAVEKIALGRIVVSNEAQAERRLTMMDDVVSPSEIATFILKDKDEQWDKAKSANEGLTNVIGVRKKEGGPATSPQSTTPTPPPPPPN